MSQPRVPGWVFAVVAMTVLQLGAALTPHLYPIVGPGGAGWLRLVGGALIVGVVSMGLNMLGADPQWKVLLTGILIIGAVAIDQWIRKVSG